MKLNYKIKDREGNCLMFLCAAPEKNRTRGRSAAKKEETVFDLIFNVEAHSGKDLRHFKFLSVSFMAQLLSSERFVGKVGLELEAVDLMLILKCPQEFFNKYPKWFFFFFY